MKLCGMYYVQHSPSGKLYVGTTSDLAKNEARQRSALKHQRHSNRALQALYDDSPAILFHYVITEDLYDAYAHAQTLIDRFKGTSALLNIGTDAKYTHRGKRLSQKTQQQMRQSKIGRRLSPSHIEHIRQSKQGQPRSPETIAKIRQSALKRAQRVSIDGIVYDSLQAAAGALGVNKGTIRNRVQSLQYPAWYYL